MRINGHTVTITKRTTGEYGLHFDNQFAGDFPSKAAARNAGKQMARTAHSFIEKFGYRSGKRYAVVTRKG